MRACVIVSVGIVLAVVNSRAHADVINGDFSDSGLNGWTQWGNVTDGGGVALLAEDPISARSSLEQTTLIGTDTTSLSFWYSMDAQPDGTFGSPMPDCFAASLLDPTTYDPLLYTSGAFDFFYQDNTGAAYFDPSLVTVNGNLVTLNLSSIAPNTNVLLAFDLFGSDDGMATSVRLDNVQVQVRSAEVVPLPAAAYGSIALLGLCAIARRRALTRR